MGAPPPPPPPEWMGEETKRQYIRMLEAHIADAPPPWVIVSAIVLVVVVCAYMIWSVSGGS